MSNYLHNLKLEEKIREYPTSTHGGTIKEALSKQGCRIRLILMWFLSNLQEKTQSFKVQPQLEQFMYCNNYYAARTSTAWFVRKQDMEQFQEEKRTCRTISKIHMLYVKPLTLQIIKVHVKARTHLKSIN